MRNAVEKKNRRKRRKTVCYLPKFKNFTVITSHPR